MMMPTVRMVRCDDLNWHVKTVGKGPTCLLIHGTGASVHTWDNLLPFLAEHFTVVMVDLPGHAKTETPEHTSLTLPAMSEALFNLIAQEKLHAELIIGHSAGAAIMFQCCLQHPECAKRLISINGAVIPLQGLAGYLFSPLARLSTNSQWMPRLFAFRARNDRNIKKLLDSTGSTVDAASFRHYAELFQNPNHVSGVLRMMANWRLETLNAHLQQVQHPVQLIAASNDKTIPLRDTYKLQQLLPTDRVSVHIVEGGGHLLHEQDAASVARLILEPITTINDSINQALT